MLAGQVSWRGAGVDSHMARTMLRYYYVTINMQSFAKRKRKTSARNRGEYRECWVNGSPT
jgi:hypothetical protein